MDKWQKLNLVFIILAIVFLIWRDMNEHGVFWYFLKGLGFVGQ